MSLLIIELTAVGKFFILSVMYIPYERIGWIINKFINNKKIKDFFYNLKIAQNIKYIEKNKPFVIKKLKNKLETNQKINAIFYVYDETKWKCQALYNLLKEDLRFEVMVLVTKTACQNKDNPSYISDEQLIKTYNFFKEKGINVNYAYDVKTTKFIPFKNFEPDIIFYQHPWYVQTEQGPVVCSKFAITGYIPYYFPIETADIDCNLRFHKYVENYYILDEYTREKYLSKNPELAAKLKVVGYPYLDGFIASKNPKSDLCIIYAPHWTIGGNGLAYGTFEWNGQFILEYAKAHPEIKWIFKPHPLLKKALTDLKIMTEGETEEYYSQWAELGMKYESGDYLGLFEKSDMMITDCSSFLGEYFVTGKPLIHLMSDKSQFRNSDNPILKSYYRAENIEELKNLLEILPKQDNMKDLRLKILEESGLKNNSASKKVLEDILKIL